MRMTIKYSRTVAKLMAHGLLALVVCLLSPLASRAQDTEPTVATPAQATPLATETPTATEAPVQIKGAYQHYTGTVHHFGFVTGINYTSNPNYVAATPTEKETFHDYSLGVAYTLHDYVTRQFTFDLLSSFTVMTAKTLKKEAGVNRHKIILPVDCRFYLGPSEDFQAYIGTGLQWNMLQKTTGTVSDFTGVAPSKTIHQLSGNTAVGLNFLGPQNYMIHFNVGAKLHYLITDNDNINNTATAATVTATTPVSTIDLSRDRSCVVLCGGITLDIDRRKNAALMLNYERPLGTPKAEGASGFFSNTQTIALGLLFHIGGTR